MHTLKKLSLQRQSHNFFHNFRNQRIFNFFNGPLQMTRNNSWIDDGWGRGR